MKHSRTERDYQVVLAYYMNTVWSFTKKLPLSGAQHAVAHRAWERLDSAQRKLFRELGTNDSPKIRATEAQVQWLEPRRLEKDASLTPESLARIASLRLGTRKPTSIDNALEEAHQILVASRDYLDALPTPSKPSEEMLESYFFPVTFSDILNSSIHSHHFPLLPPVQAKRNNGKLTPKALKQALIRYSESGSKKDRREIREAIKKGEISCHLLENIRWDRFQRHFER